MISSAERAVERLASAKSVAALTGAGVSAESGIATFRDPGGLWEKFRPEELANLDAFMANPGLVQAWYQHRRDIVTNALPNPAHEALARLEDLYEDFTLITQNVDGLHARAGSRNVVELHGNLTRNYCIGCGRELTDVELDAMHDTTYRCTSCGGLIRPDVVWFGEMLPESAVRKAQEAASRADVFLSVGTSALVYPAAALPLAARASGAFVIEINTEPSAIADQADVRLTGPAGEILPEVLASVTRSSSHESRR
jgi:NAD-dependent deacetylase